MSKKEYAILAGNSVVLVVAIFASLFVRNETVKLLLYFVGATSFWAMAQTWAMFRNRRNDEANASLARALGITIREIRKSNPKPNKEVADILCNHEAAYRSLCGYDQLQRLKSADTEVY